MPPLNKSRVRRSLSDALAQHSGQVGDNHVAITPAIFGEPKGPAAEYPFVRTIYPPWVYKLPISQDFNQTFYRSVLAAGVGAEVIPVSFQVAPSFVGFCQQFIIYALSPLATTDIEYTLRVNQNPVQGWSGIPLPPGATNITMLVNNDLQVRLQNEVTVDVLVRNLSGAGPWTVGAAIAGWTHPESEEQRIYGSL